MTATARKQASQPRFTTYYRKTTRRMMFASRGKMKSADIGCGYDYEITDETTGLVVRSGWVAGPRKGAVAEAKQAIRELESK